FFQAEDGIRDFHVTGVQTCALPISPKVEAGKPTWFTNCFMRPLSRPEAVNVSAYFPKRSKTKSSLIFTEILWSVKPTITPCSWRSEERRVGKECRPLWLVFDYREEE